MTLLGAIGIVAGVLIAAFLVGTVIIGIGMYLAFMFMIELFTGKR